MDYLTFRLGAEQYGVEIVKVQEITSFTTITPLPDMPASVRGAMHLRGTVVPVIDLRVRVALPAADSVEFSVVIVVKVGAKVMGLLVDAVSAVLDIAPAHVQAAPDFGAGVDARAVSGLARAGEKVILLLDVDRILTGVPAEVVVA